jgi:preprotein translocase subunit SecE
MAENVIVRSVGSTSTFLKEVQQEMKKVTWPDKAQLRQATIVILVFVGIVGLVIFAMDWVLQLVLLRLIPALFGA